MGNREIFNAQEKRKIRCGCGKESEITLVRFGGGWTGVCPECKGVAYNKEKLPEEIHPKQA